MAHPGTNTHACIPVQILLESSPIASSTTRAADCKTIVGCACAVRVHVRVLTFIQRRVVTHIKSPTVRSGEHIIASAMGLLGRCLVKKESTRDQATSAASLW